MMQDDSRRIPGPIDPDPFTIIALFFAFAGSAGTIASAVLQQRNRLVDKVEHQENVRVDLLSLCDQLEEELLWLVEMADNIDRFVIAISSGLYSLPNTRLGLTSLSPNLNQRELDQYHNIKVQLAKRCGNLFNIEREILRLLPRYRIDLSDDAVRRSERFREQLRVLTSGGIKYDRALQLIGKVAESGRRFVDDLRNALG